MHVIQYNELKPAKLKKQFERVVGFLEQGDFKSAEVKKMAPRYLYRAKLNQADRLLFKIGAYKGQTCILLLEIVHNHAYENSRFLNGAVIDETKLAPFHEPAQINEQDAEKLIYFNQKEKTFHVLDKILFFDEVQAQTYRLYMPLILIGSAGSGKTILTLEKMKVLTGDILYVTHSPYLVENARNLYYAQGYENEAQNIDFLSFKEYLESIRVPDGQPVSFRSFWGWFQRHRASSPVKDSHKIFEEFNGVLTGRSVDKPYLERDDYLNLGIRQSIFLDREREAVYDLFEKYLEWLADSHGYDQNIQAWKHLALCTARYNYVVVDEVQDLTNVQLQVILKSLRQQEHFILCGDSNQIVHPNFFSWSALKTMFYESRAKLASGKPTSEIVRILHNNYRNAPEIVDVANKLLKIKNTRFGSIDRESNYLVHCVSEQPGEAALLKATDAVLKDLNRKTSQSAKYAVIVLRAEDKAKATRYFMTPLVFSIQEAKGLEYENILLFNIVSENAQAFNEITQGVTQDDLEQELSYARAKDKSDKALEAYKFYINALYVALTRAMHRVYIIEEHMKLKLWELLDFRTTQKVDIKQETSSQEDWKEEARKLEMQGKLEQAEAIRKKLLHTEATPWQPLDWQSLEALRRDAFDPDNYNKKAKKTLYEFAHIHGLNTVFEELVNQKFNRAKNPQNDAKAIFHRYDHAYTQSTMHGIGKELEKYGVHFRDPMNRTPLMVAAGVGNLELVRLCLELGAKLDELDNWGHTPFQRFLLALYEDHPMCIRHAHALYKALAPSSIKMKIEERMIKIDQTKAEFLWLSFLLACLGQMMLKHKSKRYLATVFSGASSKDFLQMLERFPDSIVPPYRKKRSYVSSVLARNEVFRDAGGCINRKLFVRVARGYYVFNPTLQLSLDKGWTNSCDLLQLPRILQTAPLSARITAEKMIQAKDDPRLMEEWDGDGDINEYPYN